MAPNIACSPFSRAVVSAMRKLYPESLADKSWDNTGLLLEAPFDPLRRQMNSVLLTVDLTKAVVDEAIERNDSIIIAYHPIIFSGLKSITLGNSQQQSLLRLAAEGISVSPATIYKTYQTIDFREQVYSPHTALDAAPGGLGDWLADIVTGEPASAPSEETEEVEERSGRAEDSDSDPFTDKATKRPVYMLQHHPSQRNIKNPDLKLASRTHTRTVISSNKDKDIPEAGMGRIVRFNEPQPLSAIIDRIARGVGNPKGFPIAVPQGKSIGDMKISSVAICAGSGGSLFAKLDDIDLLFTGELDHHAALAAIERGQCVVTLFHSNSERGFLHSVLRTQLQDKVKDEWEALRKEEQKKKDLPEELAEVLEDDSVIVENSEKDRDPYGLIISKG